MKSLSQRSSSGFTLVEILVTIVILAVLATISLVALRSGMNRANSAKAMNNMRQIATMIGTYASDHHNRLPALRSFQDDEPGQPVNWHWNQEVASLEFPDVQQNKISDDKSWWLQNKPAALNPQMPNSLFETYYSGYAMNLFISENYYVQTNPRDWEMILRNETPLSALRDPTRTPLLVPHWNWHTGDLLSGAKLNDFAKSKNFLINGAMSVVFVDGHSEVLRFASENGEELSVNEYYSKQYHLMPKF